MKLLIKDAKKLKKGSKHKNEKLIVIEKFLLYQQLSKLTKTFSEILKINSVIFTKNGGKTKFISLYNS